VPRGLAIALVLLPFLGVIVGLIVLLVPEIQKQLFELVGRLPQLAQRVADWVLALRQRLLVGGSSLLTDAQIERLRNVQASDLVALVSSKWDAISRHLLDIVLGVGRGVGAGLGLVLTVLGYVVVAPVVTFYLLVSWPTLEEQVVALVPPAKRPALFGFLKEYDRHLGRFVRGQLTEATLVAVLTTAGLAVLSFPGAILMGVIAGLGNLIPTVGLFLSLIPGLLIALVAPEIGPALIRVIAVFAVVQVIDGQITGPKIVGGSVGLNPVWMMMAVLIFGALLGIVGMFLAVPLAVLCKMVVVRAMARYRASPMYQPPVRGEA
jgi:predicted PurR-regulated permease PerM